MEIFQYGFMVRALAAGIIIAVIAPLIGHFLVIRRFSLIADTLSHVALAGVALGLLLHTAPLVTTVALTVVVSLVIESLRTRKNLSGDAVLAMFLPGGLALAVVLLSLAGGFNTNLFGYLFGSITTVRPDEVGLIAILGAVVIAAIFGLYHQLLYSSFDEEGARVGGIPVTGINSALIVLTAITVSLAMRVVGALLVGSLMVIPTVTAMQIARSFKQSLLLSVVFALGAVVAGLFLAYFFSLPAGGAIVLLSLGLFGLISMFSRLF